MSFLNCWPDCLAKFIYPGPSYGAWVRCITIDGEVSSLMGTTMWNIELLSATNCRHQLTGDWQLRTPGYKAHAADKWLRPIPPDELRGVEEEDTYNAEAHEAAYP